MRWADLPIAALVALAVGPAFACGDGGDDSPDTATPAPAVVASATAPGVAAQGDPGLTVRNVVQACREKDAELLQSYVAGNVALPEIEAMLALGIDVQLLSQTVPESPDDEATISVGLRIRREATTDEVEREWRLVRGDDGLWRLTELPDCF